MSWFRKHILENDSVFIIAEAGINHNGHFDLALELVERAKKAGADCVKFQTFRTSASESKHSGKPGYFSGRIGNMSKHEWSRSLEFSEEQFSDLMEHCRRLDIAFLSTACDIEGLRILEKIGAEAVKIASADTNNDYLLAAVAGTRLPVILSTGMSTMDEVSHAMEILQKSGAVEIALMQCTSQYPTPHDQINLRVIETYRRVFGRPVGFSDHSEGIHIPVAAVAVGARMIEKHFTLSRNLPGVDHAASLDPSEFARMVEAVRQVEAALGSVEKRVQPEEVENIKSMRRSLMAARPLHAGTILRPEDITAKRPGTGLPPTRIGEFLGKRLNRDLDEEDLLSPGMVE
ncbi:MAG: N-acetylneuraminate synthase [Desulfobacteraceae bacterium]|nr:MAG: N-acetylneuraminate synthase [Desulfobacteraceae bacterium]